MTGQEAFLDDVIDLLRGFDVKEISASNLAEGWGMHSSTVRTWLHRGFEQGTLDRRRSGRQYLYRLSDDLPTVLREPNTEGRSR